MEKARLTQQLTQINKQLNQKQMKVDFIKKKNAELEIYPEIYFE
jgi:hypothetical protein